MQFNVSKLDTESKNSLIEKIKQEKEYRMKMIREGRTGELISGVSNQTNPLQNSLTESKQSEEFDPNNLYYEFHSYVNNQPQPHGQPPQSPSNINPSDATNTTDIPTLIERDRGMMYELEKMKEERRRIIESITKEGSIQQSGNGSQAKTGRENAGSNYGTQREKENFEMIRSEFKTGGKNSSNLSSRNNNYKSSDPEQKNKITKNLNNSYSNDQKSLKNNENNENPQKGLKKQLSFGNMLKNKKKSVAEELIEKRESELTFKPKTNKLPAYLNSQKEYNKDHLFKDMREKWRKREEERMKKEDEEIEENYTFHPRITNEAEPAKRIQAISSNMPREANERLYSAHSKLDREVLKKQKEDEEKQKYSYNPSIGIESKALAYKKRNESGLDLKKPIFEQLIESKKVKEAKQRQRIVEDEMTKGEFKPSINEISSWIAEQKSENKNVYARLTRNQSEKAMDFEDVNCTFQPNKRDISMISGETKIGRFDEFLERQKKFIENKENAYNNNKLDKDCYFKPKLNVCSEFLVETNQERRNETQNEKIERLMNEKVLNLERLESKKSQYETDNKFKPEINEYSKQLQRNFEDLLKPKAKEVSTQQSVEESYDFKPKSYTQKSVWNKRVESNYTKNNLDSALDKFHESKENKMSQMKKEKEYDELRQCSFKPKTNPKNLSKAGSQVDVRGMNSFLENIERKKRLDALLEERKKQVFGTGEDRHKSHYQLDARGSKVTKTEPFNLKERDDSRLAALKSELEYEFQSKYTFKPNTLEAVNKNLIMEVLSEDYEY